MKATMIIEGLITPTDLEVINEACKGIAEKLRRDIDLQYTMATPYTVNINRPIRSIMDLDDDVDGRFCLILDKKDVESGCCDEDDDPKCKQLSASAAIKK